MARLAALADNRLMPVGRAEQIGRLIDSEILARNLAPGAFIGREADLMLRFSVSRPTLRRAIRRLEVTNRVMTRPGARGGLFVKDVSATAVMTLAWHVVMLGQPLQVFLQTYMPIFASAAVLAAERASAADRRRIAAIHVRMMAEPDSLRYFQKSRIALRTAILEASGNPALAILGTALVQAYVKILRGELHLGDTEMEKTRAIKYADGHLAAAVVSGNVSATAHACQQADAREIAITEDTVNSGMVPARSVPQTLFAPVSDGQRPDKLAEHMARALRREIAMQHPRSQAALGSLPEIAAHFGVSNDICREALGLLAGHGIVTLQRGRGGGVRIGRPTIANFEHVLRRDLAGSARREQLDELRAVLAQVRGRMANAEDANTTIDFLDELMAFCSACLA